MVRAALRRAAPAQRQTGSPQASRADEARRHVEAVGAALQTSPGSALCVALAAVVRGAAAAVGCAEDSAEMLLVYGEARVVAEVLEALLER